MSHEQQPAQPFPVWLLSVVPIVACAIVTIYSHKYYKDSKNVYQNVRYMIAWLETVLLTAYAIIENREKTTCIFDVRYWYPMGLQFHLTILFCVYSMRLYSIFFNYSDDSVSKDRFNTLRFTTNISIVVLIYISTKESAVSKSYFVFWVLFNVVTTLSRVILRITLAKKKSTCDPNDTCLSNLRAIVMVIDGLSFMSSMYISEKMIYFVAHPFLIK